MQELLFVFGRNKELSLLEAVSYFRANGFEFQIQFLSKDSVIFQLPDSFKSSERIKDFGGIVKIGKVMIHAGGEGFDDLKEKLEAIDFTERLGKKFFYSIQDYGETQGNNELCSFIGEYFKQKFKGQRLKAMFKQPKQVKGEKKNTISPKLLAKRLATEHLDLFFIDVGEKILLGETVASSNPLDFAERDTQRPVVKAELVTSVRLARILVNLAGAEKGKTILDPFCGIGSIMQEILLSRHNAIGVDASAENASACEQNLEWTKKKYHVQREFSVFNNDSRRLSSFLKQGSFQAVVSEPYLGPYLRKLPSQPTAERTARELESLYAGVFKELSKLLSKGGKVVFIMPVFPTIQNKKVKIPETVFLNNGFKKANPLLKELPDALPFVYKDAESRIERLIYVLEKTL
ncbi:MAG: hypothetical protein Q7R70_05870 [Candidatus Diapherotrites archaeon]|nr:hypothetical protein [Candidatus Diapherotrites archaeon]